MQEMGGGSCSMPGGYTKHRIFGQDTSRKKMLIEKFKLKCEEVLKCNLENLGCEGVDWGWGPL